MSKSVSQQIGRTPVESKKELSAVITIVTFCALIISLFGGYLDEPNTQRLASITKAIFQYLKENSG